MELNAKAFKYGDDINTDYIISGKYKFKSTDMEAMAVHAMEELDPDYYDKVKPDGGVPRRRHQLRHGLEPRAGAAGADPLQHQGGAREELRAHLLPQRDQHRPAGRRVRHRPHRRRRRARRSISRPACVRNLTKGTEIPFPPLPPVMAQLLADGGLVEHFRKHGGFNI